MSFIITIISAILFWSAIFVNIANAHDSILECLIRDGQTEIQLTLRRTKQLLANRNLPVWITYSRKRKYHQRDNPITHKLGHNFVEENIGDFIFYHDKENSAAVTLFQRTDTLIGFIDTRYAILGLPLEKCDSGVDVGEYVKYVKCDVMNPDDHLKALDLSMRRGIGPMTKSDGSVPRSENVADDSVTTLYPEIMVYIPYDITKIIKTKQDNYLAVIVATHITHFNVIDMLISKLSTDNIEIYINLAGIVIEDKENVFNFFYHYDQDVNYIDVDKTYERTMRDGSQNYVIFPQDSFDFSFIPTRYRLWRPSENYGVEGFSWNFNVYEVRRDRMSHRYKPGAIAVYIHECEYVTASHEIAHLMSVGHDPSDEGFYSCHSQCYAIMQEVGNYCVDCLKWSDKSIKELKNYARQNPDHCFLLNRPRSLHPYGSRIKTLSPSEQCRCYGFEPRAPTQGAKNRIPDLIPRTDCGQSLICGRGSESMRLPIPIDGTPCGHNEVCWDQICKPIWNVPRS